MPTKPLLIPVEASPALQAGLQRLIDLGRSALASDELFEVLAVNLQIAIALRRQSSAVASPAGRARPSVTGTAT